MNSTKNKYPGFIDGLKASNINSYKISLNVYSEQIESNISNIINSDDLPVSVLENLQKALITIKSTVDQEKAATELLQDYIKFGDLYKTISADLYGKFDFAILKNIAVNYLNIAKFTKDTRVKNLAIEIAKIIE